MWLTASHVDCVDDTRQADFLEFNGDLGTVAAIGDVS
jgi:hypothetical protein